VFNFSQYQSAHKRNRLHPEKLLKPEQAADQLQTEIDRFIEAGQRQNTCKVEVRVGG
jgi:hypothetical protein